ncbi:membrane-flanked domain-containing protein [Natrialba chahannaoensis JCM 10990]|uniref:Membrane-flanked domain-containing protein n=1 Tax=Natrialba chahannaoensis JCM 10990 TaxID=1227492 RepID=M0AUK7_9EURY|nr:PH domain-containing protein [Natrialba chahannaoensis]ELZ02250.1 membrane-flanked domain-containing protein [Natrialba chahannaoensis JCM 10990]
MTPSTLDWLHLSDGERIVWESRPHPVTMGIRMPIAVGLVLVGFILTGWSASDGMGLLTYVGIALALGGAIVALIQYVFWRNTHYVITSAELYKKHGVVSRDVTQFRLDRVQNATLQQSVVGRVLGYGTLTVYTAGSGDPELTFERVPQPQRASGVLSDELGEITHSSSPI